MRRAGLSSFAHAIDSSNPCGFAESIDPAHALIRQRCGKHHDVAAIFHQVVVQVSVMC
jgi:hypothetical protein